MATALSRPYSIGYTDDILGAFHVQGWGDSWEEACRKAGLIE